MNRSTGIISILILCLSTVCSAFGEENIQYKTVQVKKVSCEIGVLYRQLPNGDMEIEVSVLATGKGSKLRDWSVDDIKLDINGELVRNTGSIKFYASKESIFRYPAAVVFAAIGTQYERYAGNCSSGDVCPVTGESQGGTRSTGAIADGIDKTGMAVGLGLLTSQAKGEITGTKNTFLLNRELAAQMDGIEDNINIVLENRADQRKLRAKTDLPNITADFADKHPGTETLRTSDGSAENTEKKDPEDKMYYGDGFDEMPDPFYVYKKMNSKMQRKTFKYFGEEIAKMSENMEDPDPREAMRRAIKRAEAGSNPDDWGAGETVL